MQTGSDLGSLYVSLGHRLERIVARDVRVPSGVVEDACQFAWSQLACRRDDVSSGAELAWLARTAEREALRLLRRANRDESLDALLEGAAGASTIPASAGLDELVEAHELLGSISSVPIRQQRLLWLQALGLSYVEMAIHEGCTPRTVERQLIRARVAVRAGASG